MSPVSPQMQALIDQATSNESAEASAVALLTQLAGLLTNVAGDKQATLDLAGQLKSSSDALAAAVVANTPAA